MGIVGLFGLHFQSFDHFCVLEIILYLERNALSRLANFLTILFYLKIGKGYFIFLFKN